MYHSLSLKYIEVYRLQMRSTERYSFGYFQVEIIRQQESYPLAKRNVSHAVCVARVRMFKRVSFFSTNSAYNYKWNIANVSCFSNTSTHPLSYINLNPLHFELVSEHQNQSLSPHQHHYPDNSGT